MNPWRDGFADRKAAGITLSEALQARRLAAPVMVLGLPRGGVLVAFQVALVLSAPLDVLVVRKVGAPNDPELAIGAIAAGGVTVQEPHLAAYLRRQGTSFERLAQRECAELARRERVYRAERPALKLGGHAVVLVDDGVATGCTMIAAIRAARRSGAARVIAAAPVASEEAADRIGSEADESLFLNIPTNLSSIGMWYGNFDQTEDDEVRKLLAQSPD
jgi:putative phosphoribosyl transferase